MRRHRFAVVAAAVVLLGVSGPQHPLSAEDAVAILTGLKGTVEAAHADEGTWKKAEIGLLLQVGDTLRTGDGSTVTLLLANGKKLNVFARSTVDFSPEMAGGAAGRAAFKALWTAMVGKFSESRDITRGVVGTTRGPKKALVDAPLADAEQAELSAQVDEVEAADVDETSRSLMLGVLFEGARQYERAEARYRQAIEGSPAEGRLYDALGSLYFRLGQKEKLSELREEKKKAADAADPGDAPRGE
jgi:hypothetical protein